MLRSEKPAPIGLVFLASLSVKLLSPLFIEMYEHNIMPGKLLWGILSVDPHCSNKEVDHADLYFTIRVDGARCS